MFFTTCVHSAWKGARIAPWFFRLPCLFRTIRKHGRLYYHSQNISVSFPPNQYQLWKQKPSVDSTLCCWSSHFCCWMVHDHQQPRGKSQMPPRYWWCSAQICKRATDPTGLASAVYHNPSGCRAWGWSTNVMEKDYIYIVYTLINWDINWDTTVWDIMVIQVIDSDKVDEKITYTMATQKNRGFFRCLFSIKKSWKPYPPSSKMGKSRNSMALQSHASDVRKEIWLNMCIYIYIHIRLKYIYIHINIDIDICLCVYIYTHIHTYIYIYTYVQNKCVKIIELHGGT